MENLAADLQKEFPGVQRYSARNIWYMRMFYITYYENTKLQPMVAEISWTIVEYALRQSRKPIGVSKYQIVSKLPASLRKELPAPEQIAKLMDEIK